MEAFALAGTVFCRSNREEWNPKMACVAYRQSTENLKAYMQRQWSLVRDGWHVQGDGIDDLISVPSPKTEISRKIRE